MKKNAKATKKAAKHGGARPGSGRPRSENPRRKTLSRVRVTDEEDATISQRAKAAGMTDSDWVRARLGL